MSGAKRRPRETGFATAEWMMAVGLSFLFMVMMVNFIAVQYGRGVLRAAADEGARTGARVVSDPVSVCQARENQILDGLGSMAGNVQATCVQQGGQIHAQASAQFKGWLPGIPTFNENANAISHAEKAPAPAP